jgi:hypothetical protein
MTAKYFLPKNKNQFVPKKSFGKKYPEFTEWAGKGIFAGTLVGTTTLPFSTQPLLTFPVGIAAGTISGVTVGTVREIYTRTLKRKKRKKR